MRVLIGGLLLAFSGLVAGQSLPAFYGAEGGGALSVGGRGGVVCEVTSLANSGSGTLRACVDMQGARTVVFRVGGTINLTSTLSIRHPHITIAGHTAPGGGIQLSGKNNGCTTVLRIHTNDVVIRYLRIRKGICDPANPGGPDGVGIDYTTAPTNNMPNNIILDHVSIFWSHDENMGIWGWSSISANQAPKNITLQNSILAEALTGHSTNFLTGSNNDAISEAMTDIDIRKNLFANTSHRNPLINSRSSRIVNNILYNWYGYAVKAGPNTLVDVINNRFKAGPIAKWRDRPPFEVFGFDAPDDNCELNGTMRGVPSLYVAGNIGPHNSNPDADNWPLMVKEMSCMGRSDWSDAPLSWRRPSPLSPVGVPITALPVTQLESHLLPIVGVSRRLDCMGNWVSSRDSQDARIINEYQNNQGYIPSSETQVGGFPTIAGGTPCQDTDGDGMPDEWEIAMGLNPNDPSDRNMLHPSGYTMLEMYLNGPMDSQPPPPPPPDDALPRIVQTATGFVNDGNAFDLVFGTAPTEGNKIMFIGNISKFSDGTRVATIPDFSSDAVLGNDLVSMAVLSKTAGAAEGATYTVSVSGTVQKHAGILYEIEGANNADFFNALELTESLTSPAVVPTVVGVRPIAALALNLNQSLDPPSGWMNLITVLPINHPLYAVNRAVGTDTTTSYSATWGSGASPVSATILINPADYEPPEPFKTIVPPSGLRYVR